MRALEVELLGMDRLRSCTEVYHILAVASVLALVSWTISHLHILDHLRPELEDPIRGYDCRLLAQVLGEVT